VATCLPEKPGKAKAAHRPGAPHTRTSHARLTRAPDGRLDWLIAGGAFLAMLAFDAPFPRVVPMAGLFGLGPGILRTLGRCAALGLAWRLLG
jgi:hypothetical protein